MPPRRVPGVGEREPPNSAKAYRKGAFLLQLVVVAFEMPSEVRSILKEEVVSLWQQPNNDPEGSMRLDKATSKTMLRELRVGTQDDSLVKLHANWCLMWICPSRVISES